MSASSYMVGIGASAGGLDAIKTFFKNSPNMNNVSFIVVQHLSPDFVSIMDELLSRITNIPIVTITDKIPIQVGVIYLVPSTYEATIKQGCFLLHKINRAALPQPINTLFKSLALTYGPLAIGIILSGTGSDGAEGIIEIATQGGLTLAQTPEEAAFSAMPEHAITTQKITSVLFVSEMPIAILDFMNQPTLFNQTINALPPINESEFNALFTLLNHAYHINFSLYKPQSVLRRIQRRMQLQGINDITSFIAYLTQDPNGLELLYHDLLIGVTQFFRDPEAFAILKNDIIPALFHQFKEKKEDIRVWVAACATGEEVYSIALLFKAYADEHNFPFSVKFFASDVSNAFIKTAKKGCFSSKSIKDIPAPLLNKYFIRSNHHYEIIPEIKKSILFTTHNLLRDPPFTRIDLISCRNLLIYSPYARFR